MGGTKKPRKKRRDRSQLLPAKRHPDENYARALDVAADLLSIAKEKSTKVGEQWVDYRRGMATRLFARLLGQMTSLLTLCPGSRLNRKGDIWDYSSIATVTRALLECWLFLFYLYIEEVDEVERNARWSLAHLHDCTSRLSIIGRFQHKLEDGAWDRNGLTSAKEELVSRLRNNSYFLSFPERQQTHFLRGRNATFLSQDEIVAKMGVDKDDFRWYYEFISQHVHSLPMSFYEDDGVAGRGVENEKERTYTMLAVVHSALALEAAVEAMDTLFPDSRMT